MSVLGTLIRTPCGRAFGERSWSAPTEVVLGAAPNILEYLTDGGDDRLELAQLPMAFMCH